MLILGEDAAKESLWNEDGSPSEKLEDYLEEDIDPDRWNFSDKFRGVDIEKVDDPPLKWLVSEIQSLEDSIRWLAKKKEILVQAERRHLVRVGIQNVFDDIHPTEETKSRFRCELTGDHGCDTGRVRWRVTCRACGGVVHQSTTNPNAWGDDHECPEESKC